MTNVTSTPYTGGMRHLTSLLVLAVLAVAVSGAGSASSASKPQLLVTVSASGGLCPPSMCHWGGRITTTTISADGRLSAAPHGRRARRADAGDRSAPAGHAAAVQGNVPDRLRRPGAPLPVPRQARAAVVHVRPPQRAGRAARRSAARESQASIAVDAGRQPAGRVNWMSTPAGIEITGLSKSYGPIEAVRDVDVAVAPGETVALLGPNGAGKSTTIDMLLGLLEPDAGSVSIFGSTPTAAVDRGAVGAMLQTGALLRDLTARELVSMMAALYPSAARGRRGPRADRRRATSPTSARRSSPAARRSGCGSLSPSSRIPICSSSTSRRRRWTSRAATRSGRRCASSRRAGRPSSSPPTTSRRPTRTPTGSC